MAKLDLEAFLRERAQIWDPNLDVAAGSPFDVKVIQPLLRRLGADPFTVPVETFIRDRISQEHPEYAIKEGDALMDLLVKPAQLLLDPVVRENKRVKDGQSLQDPSTLTLEEADALGANSFNDRQPGDFARGIVRIYFSTPQVVSVSPANYATAKDGQKFFPASVQSIRSTEMLLNTEGSLYYFDVSLIAEASGEEYNIGPDEIVSVSNLSSAVRVTNKRKFRGGLKEETAEEYATRIKEEVGEQSLVAERGIKAKLRKAFPEVTRVAVVGFSDPEMERDILQGGGLGPVISGGVLATPLSDGEGGPLSRRVRVDASENPGFLSSIGPAGAAPSGYVLTLLNGQPSTAVPKIRDFDVLRVIDNQTLDLGDQALQYDVPPTGGWVLRKKELTLSKIPGGIVFPEGASGVTTIRDGEVHIGGMVDIYVGSTSLDNSSVLITGVSDESPILSGVEGEVASGSLALNDLSLGVDYELFDSTYTALDTAVERRYAVRILNGTNPGTFSVLGVSQGVGTSPSLVLRDGPPTQTGLRWQLLDEIDIDLLEPKELKVSGSDMVTTQSVPQVSTSSGVNFSTFGVSAGDILRVLSGPDTGDYLIQSVTGAFNTILVLESSPAFSSSNVLFEIFTQSSTEGVKVPLVRVSSVDLLDSASQPIGTTIPYAHPVEIRSEAFTNTGKGVKVDVRDGLLGIVGDIPSTLPITTLAGKTLQIRTGSTEEDPFAGGSLLPVTFSGSSLSLEDVANQINATAGLTMAVVLPGPRLGIIPLFTGSSSVGVTTNTAAVLSSIFGSATFNVSSRDVRSPKIGALTGGWTSEVISPPIDDTLDVVQVLDGIQVGTRTGPTADTSSVRLEVGEDFLPETGVHVQVGSRSLGLVRLYFLEPTSIEVGPGTFFTVSEGGSSLRFIPDLNTSAQKIPALPDGETPKDGVLALVDTSHFSVTSVGTDFVAKEILPGDKVVLDYLPLIGSVALADPVAGLADVSSRTLVLSTEDGVDQTITFVNDSSAIAATAVTRQGVANQINRTIGRRVASINSANKLEIEPEFSLTIKSTGTANTLLGFSTTSNINNESPNKQEFTVTEVSSVSSLVVAGSFSSIAPHVYTDMNRHHVKVIRPRTQRVCSTDMAKNVAEAGLYYCDFELMSDGTGDQFNIADRTLLRVSGHRSDGYYLTTDESVTSFSTGERPRLHLSRKILPVGVSDDPTNAVELAGQNIQVNYDRSTVTSDVQSYVLSDEERVVNANPLVRHLIPYFVRFDLNYVGGSRESVVQPDVESYVNRLNPQDSLTSDGVQSVVKQRGATSIDNPVELIAVVHDVDRTVRVERSQDRLNTGRLAAFIPDQIRVSRRVT